MSVMRAQLDLSQIEQKLSTLEQKVTKVETEITGIHSQLHSGGRRNPYPRYTTSRY